MKERIQILAEQAGITVRCHYDKSGLTSVELEKFAEVVVRECADVAGRDVGHFVLEHFGLKECGK